LLKVHNFVIEDPIQEGEAIIADPVDHKLAYMKASFTFNLPLRTMNDCVREGDSPRLINAYKVALLHFKCYGHHKYALSLSKLFCTIKLEPKKAFRLIIESVYKHERKERQEHIARFTSKTFKPFLKGTAKKPSSEFRRK